MYKNKEIFNANLSVLPDFYKFYLSFIDEFVNTGKFLQNEFFDMLNESLKESMKQTATNALNLRLIQGSDSLDINLLDTKSNEKIYNENESLSEQTKYFNENFSFHPILYFYGFGSGILFKLLLQNKHLNHIVVFERHFEILYHIFHIVNFSKELENKQIIILSTDILDSYLLYNFFKDKPFFNFLRVFNLHIMSDFYAKNTEFIKNLNEQITTAIRNAVLMFGNDTKDSLTGMHQCLINMPFMIQNLNYKSITSKTQSISKNKTAVIVATGPSLIKQLPILKANANKLVIFCVDASYSILQKHGIVPDFVFSNERGAYTSKFFDNNFTDFDKDIIFVLNLVTYPDSIKFLENKTYKNYSLVLPASYFWTNLKLHKFGYITAGKGVANIAFENAISMGFERIILIGQDLAYGDDGTSHPSEYLYGKYDLNDRVLSDEFKQESVYTTAYGGKGMVRTRFIWNHFREGFEMVIASYPNVKVYNSTQAGARINGSIERPFDELCNELEEDLQKPLNLIDKTSHLKSVESGFKVFYKLIVFSKHCLDLTKRLENLLQDINELKLSLNENNSKLTEQIFAKIDEAKMLIEAQNGGFLFDILCSLMAQFELNLAKLYVIVPKNKEQAFQKSLLWIDENIFFIENVLAQVKIVYELINEDKKYTQNYLLDKGYEKYVDKILSKI